MNKLVDLIHATRNHNTKYFSLKRDKKAVTDITQPIVYLITENRNRL